MELTKPTKQEVFNSLRNHGCIWLGGHGCECRNRQLKGCYEEAEKWLTKATETESEIREAAEHNRAVWDEISETGIFNI